MPNIFETVDPRGFKVYCSEERWNDHIIAGHRFMTGREQAVKEAIENPSIGIFQDRERENRHIYYRLQAGKLSYIKVVVDFSNNVGSVITAFPADSAKSGEKLIWPNSKR